jgi:hypothetical protein
VDPTSRINTYLGDALPEIFQNAYDNPAAKLFDYACMPGVPMDFVNASMRAPWGFVRNTDDRYAVKLVSEEARFLDWVMTDDLFDQPDTLPRLKALGFDDLAGLHRFMQVLRLAVPISGDDLEALIALLRSVRPPLAGPPLSVSMLKTFARAWMDDVHESCNVARYAAAQDPERTAFNLAVREFRRQRPWLMANLHPGEFFDHLSPCDGTVLFYALRRAPDDQEQVLFVANMEGEPRTITPAALPIPGLAPEGWSLALSAPGLVAAGASRPVTLHDSQGLVFVRR